MNLTITTDALLMIAAGIMVAYTLVTFIKPVIWNFRKTPTTKPPTKPYIRKGIPPDMFEHRK